MVTETRIRLLRCRNRLEKCHEGTAPLEEGPSYVRFEFAVDAKHSIQRLGGGGLAEPQPDDIRQFTMTTESGEHPVDDPSVFVDYDKTRRMVWRMITALATLGCFDLSRGNWTTSMPDGDVASWIHALAQSNDDRGLCGGHYRLSVEIDMEVEQVFSEPKALVRFCRDLTKEIAEHKKKT